MRPNAQRRRLNMTPGFSIHAAIVILTLALVGCHDARISVQEFIAMQERMERSQESARTIPVRREPRSHAAAGAATCPTPPPAPTQCVPPAPSTVGPRISTPRPEPVRDESSAVREQTIVQVKTQSTPEPAPKPGKDNWFFDSKRGEWVKVTLPRKPRKRVRRASLHTNWADSYEAPEDSADEETLNDDTTTAPADGAAPHFVPVQANVPVRNKPLQPLDDLLQLAKKPYLLGPEDLITVTLTGLTGIDTIAEPAGVEVRIAHNGTINLPLVGSIHIAGLDMVSAENVIREAYVPKFVPTLAVGIRIEAFKTADVVVVGAAELPGIVNLRRNQQTVLHAVAAAGGMTQLASGEVILQRRRDPENKIRVYLRNSADLQSVMAMDPLESGDVIEVVAAQPNTIFVGGLVNMPGPREFPIGTEVTALQALAAAGGPVEAVFPKEATLIRRMPNGEDVHVRIDIEKLRSGEEENIKLAAGDIFWVPETWGTRTMNFINQSFFIRAGATVSYNVTGIEFLNRPRQQIGNFNQGGGTLQNNVDPLGFLAP